MQEILRSVGAIVKSKAPNGAKYLLIWEQAHISVVVEIHFQFECIYKKYFKTYKACEYFQVSPGTIFLSLEKLLKI